MRKEYIGGVLLLGLLLINSENIDQMSVIHSMENMEKFGILKAFEFLALALVRLMTDSDHLKTNLDKGSNVLSKEKSHRGNSFSR